MRSLNRILLVMMLSGLAFSVEARPVNLALSEKQLGKELVFTIKVPKGSKIGLPDTGKRLSSYTFQFHASKKDQWRSIRKQIENISIQYPLSRVNYRIRDRKRILELEFSFVRLTKIEVKRSSKDSLILSVKTTVPATATVVDEDDLIRQADNALHAKRFNDAVKLYSGLLESKNMSLRKRAIENLGVARLKNGQRAHAKILFQKYLETFPDDESVSRVRQRLADLLNEQLQPREPLVKTTKKRRARRKERIFFGAFNQVLTLSGNDQSFQQSPIEQSMVVSSVDFSSRVRKGNSVSRFVFYSDHAYDLAENDNEGFDIRSLFYEFRLPINKTHFSLGRHSSSQGGIAGRFDGVSVGRRLMRNVQFEMLSGFPVDYGSEDHLQQNKRFFSTNVTRQGEFFSMRPYWLVQTLDSLTDRFAVGEELDFFNADGFVRQSFDYDLHFNQWNLFSLQANYRINDDISSFFLLDLRRNPLLESSNALINEFRVDTMLELQEILEEELITEQAKQRTGTIFLASTGSTLDFLKDYFARLDATYTRQEYTLFFDDEAQIQSDAQVDSSLQLGMKNLWQSYEDLLVASLRWSRAENYTNYQGGIRYRIKPTHRLTLDQNLRINYRRSDTRHLITYRPSLKFNYQMDKAVWNQLELGYEYWDYQDQEQPDFQRFFTNIVYRYVF